MATPRVAAGALFHDGHGRFLLVKPSYKSGWDLPGGYVEPGETPAEACEREVREELALSKVIDALLVIDWAPAANEGDKLLFVFDGGFLGPNDTELISLQQDEIEDFGFHNPSDFGELLPARLARRLLAAVEAQARGVISYLEHGVHRQGAAVLGAEAAAEG